MQVIPIKFKALFLKRKQKMENDHIHKEQEKFLLRPRWRSTLNVGQ